MKVTLSQLSQPASQGRVNAEHHAKGRKYSMAECIWMDIYMVHYMPRNSHDRWAVYSNGGAPASWKPVCIAGTGQYLYSTVGHLHNGIRATIASSCRRSICGLCASLVFSTTPCVFATGYSQATLRGCSLARCSSAVHVVHPHLLHLPVLAVFPLSVLFNRSKREEEDTQLPQPWLRHPQASTIPSSMATLSDPLGQSA